VIDPDAELVEAESSSQKVSQQTTHCPESQR
jgi:hypothetical protein